MKVLKCILVVLSIYGLGEALGGITRYEFGVASSCPLWWMVLVGVYLQYTWWKESDL
jgi:hypothetical protein